MAGTVVDVADRRLAEEAIRSASSYARSLIEASLNPLVVIGPEGKVTDVNAATEAATGLTRDRLVGSDFADYFTEPEKARAGLQRVLSTGALRDHSLAIRHASGRTTEVLLQRLGLRRPGRPGAGRLRRRARRHRVARPPGQGRPVGAPGGDRERWWPAWRARSTTRWQR